jgi:hypothetical protein
MIDELRLEGWIGLRRGAVGGVDRGGGERRCSISLRRLILPVSNSSSFCATKPSMAILPG